MKNPAHHIRHKGQAAVELALLLPIIIVLIFGVFEFGRAMYVRNTLNYAARMGARAAATQMPFSQSAVKDQVRNSIPVQLQGGLTIAVSPAVPVYGTAVTVSVSSPFSIDIIPGFLPIEKNVVLLGQASMMYERN